MRFRRHRFTVLPSPELIAMPRFAANLSTMFTEAPLRERFALAAEAGFDAVEIQEPYDLPAATVAGLLTECHLDLVLVNAPGGEAGLAGIPGSRSAFDTNLTVALDYAAATGTRLVHVLSGVLPPGSTLAACESMLIDNLRQASTEAASRDITLLIEPINERDVPGYILTRQDQARRVVSAVNRANVRIQFDFYHCQVAEGDLSRHFSEQLPLIGHIQVSDNPGRHEPGTGEINHDWVFDLVDRSGYSGWVGAEYTPAGTTGQSLGWFAPWRRRRAP